MDNRPVYHITGEKGWINDPNGVVRFKNQYHIFYQAHPYSCEWGSMHWGHVVSDDLKSFKYLPYALVPGDEFDKDGCFSGVSLVKDDTLYIVYTGFIFNENPEDIRQIQCLASSKDGIHFVKHGVIIGSDDLPSEYKKCDFRDPQIVYKDDTYYLFVASKRISGGGAILLYRSKDLKKWEFVSDVLNNKTEGSMIECPSYYDDLNLLIYSEQDIPTESEHCYNIHACNYEVGKLNDKFKFESRSGRKLIDYGFDFYAPQLMANEPYIFAWLNMWGRSNPSSKYGFAGMLTIPRKVEVVDNELIQTPIICGDLKETSHAKEFSTHIVSGTVVLEVEDLTALNVEMRKGDNDEVTKFDLKDDEFYFDRSHSGEQITGLEVDKYSLSGIRKMPFKKKDKTTIYFVLDKYSIEIFVNGMAMSNVVYPNPQSDLFNLKIEAKKISLKVYK